MRRVTYLCFLVVVCMITCSCNPQKRKFERFYEECVSNGYKILIDLSYRNELPHFIYMASDSSIYECSLTNEGPINSKLLSMDTKLEVIRPDIEINSKDTIIKKSLSYETLRDIINHYGFDEINAATDSLIVVHKGYNPNAFAPKLLFFVAKPWYIYYVNNVDGHSIYKKGTNDYYEGMNIKLEGDIKVQHIEDWSSSFKWTHVDPDASFRFEILACIGYKQPDIHLDDKFTVLFTGKKYSTDILFGNEEKKADLERDIYALLCENEQKREQQSKEQEIASCIDANVLMSTYQANPIKAEAKYPFQKSYKLYAYIDKIERSMDSNYKYRLYGRSVDYEIFVFANDDRLTEIDFPRTIYFNGTLTSRYQPNEFQDQYVFKQTSIMGIDTNDGIVYF